jgi:hypothetical protein
VLTANTPKCPCSPSIYCSPRWCTSTLLVQSVLEVPEFHDLIDPDERRGLSPLF